MAHHGYDTYYPDRETLNGPQINPAQHPTHPLPSNAPPGSSTLLPPHNQQYPTQNIFQRQFQPPLLASTPFFGQDDRNSPYLTSQANPANIPSTFDLQSPTLQLMESSIGVLNDSYGEHQASQHLHPILYSTASHYTPASHPPHGAVPQPTSPLLANSPPQSYHDPLPAHSHLPHIPPHNFPANTPSIPSNFHPIPASPTLHPQHPANDNNPFATPHSAFPPPPTHPQTSASADLTSVPIVRVPGNVPVQTSDKFISLLYKYYFENGYRAIKHTRITKLATKLFAIIFTTILMVIFDWWAIVPCLRYAGGGDGSGPENDPCHILKFSRLYSTFSFAHMFAIFYATSVLLYWVWQFFGFLNELKLYREIRVVFHRAGITDDDLAHVSWSFVIDQLSVTPATPSDQLSSPQHHTYNHLSPHPSQTYSTLAQPHHNLHQQHPHQHNYQYPPPGSTSPSYSANFPHHPQQPPYYPSNPSAYPQSHPIPGQFLHLSNPVLPITSPANHIESPYIFTNVTKPYLSKEIMKIDNVMMFLLKENILRLTFPTSTELKQLGKDILASLSWFFPCCRRGASPGNAADGSDSSSPRGDTGYQHFQDDMPLQSSSSQNPPQTNQEFLFTQPQGSINDGNYDPSTHPHLLTDQQNQYATYQTLSPTSNTPSSPRNASKATKSSRKGAATSTSNQPSSPPSKPSKPPQPSSDQFFAALNNANFTRAQNERNNKQKQQLLKQQQTLYGTTFSPLDDPHGNRDPESAESQDGKSGTNDHNTPNFDDEVVEDYPPELQYVPPFSLKHVFLSPLLNWVLREVIISPFFTQIDGAKMPIPLRYYPSLTEEEEELADQHARGQSGAPPAHLAQQPDHQPHPFNKSNNNNASNNNSNNKDATNNPTAIFDGLHGARPQHFNANNNSNPNQTFPPFTSSNNNPHQAQPNNPHNPTSHSLPPSSTIYIPPFNQFLRDNLPREISIPAGIHFLFSPEVLHSQNRTNFLQYQHNIDMWEQFGVEPNSTTTDNDPNRAPTHANAHLLHQQGPASDDLDTLSSNFSSDLARSMPQEMKEQRHQRITNATSQLRLLSIASFIFLPVIIIFQLFSLIVNNIYTIQQQRSTLSTSYQWSLYSRYILRSFNELHHTFHIRLVYAMKYSRLYLKQFTPPRYVYVSQFLSFVCGCGILVAVFVTFIDARSVLVDSSNRWLLILLAVCTIIVTICRGIIDEYSFFHDNLGDIDDVRQLQFDPYIHFLRSMYQTELQEQSTKALQPHQHQHHSTPPLSPQSKSTSPPTDPKLTSFVTPSIYHDLASQSFFKHRPYITFAKVIELCKFPLLSLQYANSMVMRRFIETFLQTTGVTWLYTLIDTIFTPLIIITKVSPTLSTLFDRLTIYYQLEFQKRVEMLFQHHREPLYQRYMQTYGHLIAEKYQLQLAEQQHAHHEHQLHADGTPVHHVDSMAFDAFGKDAQSQQPHQQPPQFGSHQHQPVEHIYDQYGNLVSSTENGLVMANHLAQDANQPSALQTNPSAPTSPNHSSHANSSFNGSNSPSLTSPSNHEGQPNQAHQSVPTDSLMSSDANQTMFQSGFHPGEPAAYLSDHGDQHFFNPSSSTIVHPDDSMNVSQHKPPASPPNHSLPPINSTPPIDPLAAVPITHQPHHLHAQPDGQVVAFNTDLLPYAQQYQHDPLSEGSELSDEDGQQDEDDQVDQQDVPYDQDGEEYPDYDHDQNQPYDHDHYSSQQLGQSGYIEDDQLSHSSFEPLD